MENMYRVFIIDEHPFVTESYKYILKKVASLHGHLKFEINVYNDLNDAYQRIKKLPDNNSYLFLLDINLPPTRDNSFLSGEDLGVLINEMTIQSKIVILTALKNNYRINNIIKTVNPDALLVKSDFDSDELIRGISSSLFSPPYYSKTVLKFLRNRIMNEFVLDKIDRQLLYELSLGTKTKDLPKVVPMSITGIERRKRHLKEIFDVCNLDDKHLLVKAREIGFI